MGADSRLDTHSLPALLARALRAWFEPCRATARPRQRFLTPVADRQARARRGQRRVRAHPAVSAVRNTVRQQPSTTAWSSAGARICSPTCGGAAMTPAAPPPCCGGRCWSRGRSRASTTSGGCGTRSTAGLWSRSTSPSGDEPGRCWPAWSRSCSAALSCMTCSRWQPRASSTSRPPSRSCSYGLGMNVSRHLAPLLRQERWPVVANVVLNVILVALGTWAGGELGGRLLTLLEVL